MRQYASVFLIAASLSFISFGCNTESEDDEQTGINGVWNVTAWSQDGVADPDVLSYNVVLTITEAGVMTFSMNAGGEPFVYTGNYTINSADHIDALLNETTGNSEINQWELSVDAVIGTNQLQLDGTNTRRSQFWPDETVTVAITATR